jgi:hypothetical protein
LLRPTASAPKTRAVRALAAKQRGVRLGATGAERALRYKAEATARAIELAPVLRDLKQQGLSLRGMAAELTKRRVPTPRGGAWHPQLVARVLERYPARGKLGRSSSGTAPRRRLQQGAGY